MTCVQAQLAKSQLLGLKRVCAHIIAKHQSMSLCLPRWWLSMILGRPPGLVSSVFAEHRLCLLNSLLLYVLQCHTLELPVLGVLICLSMANAGTRRSKCGLS